MAEVTDIMRRISWLAGLWLGLTLVGSAQDWSVSRLPSSTQVYLESRPRLQLNPGPSLGERLRRSPLFRVFAEATGLDLNKPDELATFPYLDGRVVVAITRQSERSFFEAAYQIDRNQRQVNDLRYAAQMAFEGVNLYRKYQKKFPQTIQDLSTREYFDEALVPEGAKLEIRRQGKTVTVVASQGDVTVTWPDAEPRPTPALQEMGGMLFGLGCPDTTALQHFLQKWDSELEELEAEADHWKWTFEGQSMHLYAQRGWVLLVTHPGLAEPFLRPVPLPGGGTLENNPRLVQQFKRLNTADTEFWAFVDVEDILRSSPGLCQASGLAADKILMRSLALTSGARLDSAGRIEVEARGFLQWDGVQNVTLGPAEASLMAQKIPAGVETVYWVDLPGAIRLLDRITGEFPGVQEKVQTAWSEWENRLGFPIPRPSLGSGAQFFLYGEVVDSYAQQLEMIIKLAKGYFSGDLTPEVPDFKLSRLPLVGVLELSDNELAKKFDGFFRNRLGSSVNRKTVENVSYSQSPDGRDSWIGLPNTHFWANGHTQRLLPRIFNAYQGKTPNLAGLPSYQRFARGRQGELLLYLHHKVDREYSLIKGLLLYLGSDFRPEAESLGELKDMHTAIEVVPGGLQFRSEIYGRGVEAPPAIKAEEGE